MATKRVAKERISIADYSKTQDQSYVCSATKVNKTGLFVIVGGIVFPVTMNFALNKLKSYLTGCADFLNLRDKTELKDFSGLGGYLSNEPFDMPKVDLCGIESMSEVFDRESAIVFSCKVLRNAERFVTVIRRCDWFDVFVRDLTSPDFRDFIVVEIKDDDPDFLGSVRRVKAYLEGDKNPMFGYCYRGTKTALSITEICKGVVLNPEDFDYRCNSVPYTVISSDIRRRISPIAIGLPADIYMATQGAVYVSSTRSSFSKCMLFFALSCFFGYSNCVKEFDFLYSMVKEYYLTCVHRYERGDVFNTVVFSEIDCDELEYIIRESYGYQRMYFIYVSGFHSNIVIMPVPGDEVCVFLYDLNYICLIGFVKATGLRTIVRVTLDEFRMERDLGQINKSNRVVDYTDVLLENHI